MSDTFIEKATTTAMAAVEETREIADIKAKMILARQFPRDINYSLLKILEECESPKLAEIAQYSYPKGGQEVKGASIRLIEVVARHWMNIVSGTKEISRTDTGCTVKAFAWDLETNVSDEKVFDVAFRRDTKKGSYAVTEEREKYEVMANYAARRKRACLMAVIPGYVVDAAISKCEETLLVALGGGEKPIEEKRASALDNFKALVDWVTPEMLGGIIGKEFDKANHQDIVRLKKLYVSITEGFAKPEVVFGLEAEKPDLPSAAEEAAAGEITGQLGIKK